MSRHPVQVEDTGASYKIVGNNFEYCPFCSTITSVCSNTAPADMLVMYGTVQLQDWQERFLERLLRRKTELRYLLGSTAELCHGHIIITCLQHAAEERGPPEPSALILGNTCNAQDTSKQVQVSRAREDIFVPAIQETANSHPQLLVTGRVYN